MRNISFYKNKALPIQWKSQLNNTKHKLDTIKVIGNYNKNNVEVHDHYFEKRKHFVPDITHFKMAMTYLGQ